MIRLTFLVLALLAGIFVAFASLGGSDYRAAGSTSQNTQPSRINIRNLLPELPAADVESAGDVIEAARQTPERVQKFPGPALQPAPEEEVAMQADAALAGGPVLYVTGERVNFRVGPSTSHQVVGALDYGSAVVALGPTDGGWVNIRGADGTTGYMSGQFLSRESP